MFFTLGFLLLLIFRRLWVIIFATVLSSLYNRKNVLIISSNHDNISKILNQQKWLNYSIEYGVDKIQFEDLGLYITQYNLDLIIIDVNSLKESIEEWIIKLKSIKSKFFFLNPRKTDNLRLKKVIANLYFYS